MGAEDRLPRLLATASAIAANLLVGGEYDVLEAMTRGRQLSADDLQRAVEDFGVRLVRVPGSEWDHLDWKPVPRADPPTFDVSVPMWTEQGQCDLTLELRLIETPYQTYSVETRALHVVARRGRPRVSRPRAVPAQEPPPNRPTPDLYATPVPERWRPLLARIVHRLVIGDYEGLSRDGFLAYTDDPSDETIGIWIERYPGRLVDLPEEAWAFSNHARIEHEPNAWWVILDLWEEDGHSDLSLEATVRDDGSGIDVKVKDVHAL